MAGLMVRETPTPLDLHARGQREADFAACWAAGAWRGQPLRTEAGERFTVVYQGRCGGGAGPDFRDAVLVGPDGARICGDVELHLRAAGWRAHGHLEDPRYNGLVLHVTLGAAPGTRATRLASGREVPLVVLRPRAGLPMVPTAPAAPWPCAGLAERMPPSALCALLTAAGLARFRLRAEALEHALRAARPGPLSAGAPAWSPAARVLFVQLAEALAYGRDRAALRAAGERLADVGGLPDEEADLPRVERQRLAGLQRLYTRYEGLGPWVSLRAPLLAGAPAAAGRALIEALRVPGGAVSPGRAAIVVANVVLPFAAAMGATDGEAALVARAEAVYAALPGLPSNAITRLLARQIGLPRLPRGASAQLGLHHLWAVACREKRCERCPCVVGLAGAPPT